MKSHIILMRPNLKNLSRGLNLSRSSNMVGFNFSRFKPALNRNRFLRDLRRGLNSLNSDTDYFYLPNFGGSTQTVPYFLKNVEIVPN